MSDALPALFSAFILGLMSSGHCLGMCGGIACALGLQQHPQKKLALLIYHAGRITTYTLLALLFGAALQHLTHRVPLLAPALRTTAGFLLLAMALHIAQLWSGITTLEHIGTRWWKPIQQLARPLLPAKTLPQIFALGLLWGWLPCALVYSTLAWSASRADATTSALLMIFFGLGTMPVLFASGVLSQQLQKFFQQKQWRYAAASLLAIYAVWTIAASWQHVGHHRLGLSTKPWEAHFAVFESQLRSYAAYRHGGVEGVAQYMESIKDDNRDYMIDAYKFADASRKAYRNGDVTLSNNYFDQSIRSAANHEQGSTVVLQRIYDKPFTVSGRGLQAAWQEPYTNTWGGALEALQGGDFVKRYVDLSQVNIVDTTISLPSDKHIGVFKDRMEFVNQATDALMAVKSQPGGTQVIRQYNQGLAHSSWTDEWYRAMPSWRKH